MKTQHIALSFLFVFASLFTANAHNFSLTSIKKDKIRVWGECGMCKNRIEKAAKEAGAITANWNEDSKYLVVSYNDSKTSLLKIQQAIAGVGHDTKELTATEEAYNKLPGCCKYERKS
jgi:hypothetical protein